MSQSRSRAKGQSLEAPKRQAQERRLTHNARLLLELDTVFEFRLPLFRLTLNADEEPSSPHLIRLRSVFGTGSALRPPEADPESTAPCITCHLGGGDAAW